MKKLLLLTSLISLHLFISPLMACSVGGTVTGAAAVCQGANSGLLTLSGHTGVVVTWQSSVAPFTSWTTIPNTAVTYTSGALSQTTKYRVLVQNGVCAIDTSDEKTVVVTGGTTGYWVGQISSSWTDATNWCGALPGSATDVFINAGTQYSPIISSPVTINKMTIDAGASVTVGAGGALSLTSGIITNNGIFDASLGTVKYTGTYISVAGGSYKGLNLSATGGGWPELGGNVSVEDSFTCNANLKLNTHNIALGETAYVSMGGLYSGQHPGSITVKGIGVGGVGQYSLVTSGTTSDPFSLIFYNYGPKDDFTFSHRASLNSTYGPDFTPTGSPITNHAMAVALQITEAVPGGTSATMNIYPGFFDYFGSFDASTSKLCRWDGSTWDIMPTIWSGYGTHNFNLYSPLGIYIIADTSAISTYSLPVSLLSFTAARSANDIVLNWKTASETNNDHFTIERSPDNKTFETLGSVKGAGNSSKTIDYRYSDKNGTGLFRQHNVIYYRIKQVDADGRFSYSNSVAVMNENTELFEIIGVNPNPVSEQSVLIYLSSSEEPVTIRIMDAFGKVISEQKVLSVIGLNRVDLGLSGNLGAGVYVASVVKQNTTKNTKLIRQ
jgi:hypothetical protein